MSLEIGTCYIAKGGGDPYVAMEGTGKGGRPLRGSCVPEEMSVDHGCLPNTGLLCLHSRALLRKPCLPPSTL